VTQAGNGNHGSSPLAPRPTPAGHPDRTHLGPHASHRPRRRFLHSALLLLLAEKPRHGYALTNAFADLGLGDMDRPRIYRTLAELEGSGMVKVWDETSTTGQVRRVYSVTDLGHQSLSTAAEVIALERSALEGFLERYQRISRGSPRWTRGEPGSEPLPPVRRIAGGGALNILDP